MIVVGLNTGQFQFTRFDVFSRYPNSVIPKFLYGLSSKVFEDDGTLKLDRDSDAVEALLTGLRLLRRTTDETLDSLASQKAEQKFIDYQRTTRFNCKEAVADTKLVLELMFGDYEAMPHTLGSPGNGVTSDMQFPYVPQLALPDVNQLPDVSREFYERCLYNRIEILDYIRLDDLPDCSLFRTYQYSRHRSANLSVVPKSCVVGRAITVADTVSTIIGASLRETLQSRVRQMGLAHCMNTHDQTLSWDAILHFFDEVVCVDLEGGSSCLTVDLLEELFPSWVVAIWAECRPQHFKPTGSKMHYLLTVLTMGDAVSVAMLTSTLFAATVAGISRAIFGEVTRQYIAIVLSLLVHTTLGDMVKWVGDDGIFPQWARQHVLSVLAGLGVTINERKSSYVNAIHRESCGCWVIKQSDGHLRRIFPYRLPSKTNNYDTQHMAIAGFLYRAERSSFHADLFAATGVFESSTRNNEFEAYNANELGSIYGVKPAKERLIPASTKGVPVADLISYLFGLEGGVAKPRFSRVPRLVHYKRKRIGAGQYGLSSAFKTRGEDIFSLFKLGHSFLPSCRPQQIARVVIINAFVALLTFNFAVEPTRG